ncbi:MAG: hypothetical protein ACK5UM_09160 [Pseudomonadota bacterium]|jgi:hypothetical protein|nr:hypothetical protein [Rubrivivax sp.]MCA3258252.1 hypothetical protein [Rubrivivax sp.]MCE2913209.1 hypothetical protein [Rubrivivax sp.]MCZ8030668.1 hypothetical protein [Rubrivivax sp.]
MDAEIARALSGALARGAITAILVGALLLAAGRFGRRAAGLLTGLPTVTGPAMLWLVYDRGEAFTAAAAVSAVAAAIACATFALGYGLASRSRRPPSALGLAVLAGLLPLPWMSTLQWPLALWLLVASVVCLACQGALGALRRMDHRPSRPLPRTGARSVPAGSVPAGRGWLTAALVSGLVSALAAVVAVDVGPFWTGLLISPPLLAATVAVELHRRPGGAEDTLGFLHGYVAGLLVRGLFVAAFGALLLPAGTTAAFATALALTVLAGWLPRVGAALRPTLFAAAVRPKA